MREALLTWMRRQGWEAAAAACAAACGLEAAPLPPSCAALMVTGMVPEAAAQQPCERIAVKT
jgi:hypothetical protein